MTIFISIVGLGFLIFIHELGHFSASLALGMRPRKFYVGFPPAIVKRTRKGIEYGIGMVPLGGFVKIPGMHRPAPGDLDHTLGRAVADVPELERAADRLRHALGSGDHDEARTALADLNDIAAGMDLSDPIAREIDKGVTDIGDALGPDAYWRAATWRRVLVIFAGPAANILFAIVIFAVLYATTGGRPTTTVDAVRAGTAAEKIGIVAGDRIVSINGVPMTGGTIARTIGASRGTPLTLVVVRDGSRVTLGPRPADRVDDVFRLGFLLAGAGLSPLAASRESLTTTGEISQAIFTSLGNLVTGEGRKDISSPVGIVQGSSDAAKQGTDSFLWVLGLISLSIALLNLLPFLPLDGGHIVFAVIEGISGKTVARAVYERVSIVGIGLVLLLFVIGLTNDIGRLS